MQIISHIAELRARLDGEHSVAFVPTMGNLHEGHLELMRLAREHGSCVVASIFVNPLQFGPNEDFDRYPRTLESDCEKLKGLADVVFTPSVNEMYPAQQTVFVEPPPIANELCGASRPGHFRGMATVVLKLFNIVQPQAAVFGKKDYQQLHIIRQLVAQLNLPIRIIGAETVRAADGLALSSRNQYLSEAERGEATALYQTLQGTKRAILQGERDFEQLQQQAVQSLAARGWGAEYVEVRNQSDMQPASPLQDLAQRELVILAAARLGDIRLMDNIEVCIVE
jgi:pantoate--beta-alanine ligase